MQADANNNVTKLELVAKSSVRINGGYFVLRREIFDYMQAGDELVLQPFERLIKNGELIAVPYDGFWRNMDTFKDKIQLDELVAQGAVPWQVWRADRKALI